MKSLTPILIAIASLSLVSASARVSETTSEFRFHYYDMYAQTYEPVDIDSAYDLTSVVRPSEKEVLAILRRHDLRSKRFIESQTRIKMELEDGSVILVDVAGDVKEGSDIYKLNKKSREELFNALQSTLPGDLLAGH
jgi:hypothetical protein